MTSGISPMFCRTTLKNSTNFTKKHFYSGVSFNKIADCCYFTKKIPTNTARVFPVETTWKRSFPCRFNVKHRWCVYRDIDIIVLLWSLWIFSEHCQQLPHNSFHSTGLFFNPQKISENLMFPGNRPVALVKERAWYLNIILVADIFQGYYFVRYLSYWGEFK